MKYIKRLLFLFCIASLTFSMTGCLETTPVGESFSAEVNNSTTNENIVYEALFYTNNGDLYSIVEGKDFVFTPNRVKEYGYNSEGYWESYYTTSAVMTIQVDGSYIESCGNTIILKDERVTYTPVEDILKSIEEGLKDNDEDTPTLSVDDKEENDRLMSGYESYWNLRYWWSDIKEKGQGGAKMIIIQSQNGDNIGVISGNDVTWRVAEDLPKTTVITVDGKEVLIHRANFQIIDTKLLENK